MFTISVCMIVKNEQLVLKRCLECVKQFADEIIIVDTGSTDLTKKIAKEYSNKVFDFEWCDDFSKARNFSFSFATKDYIMWLDADDVISQENINKILKLKRTNTTVDIFMFKYEIAFDNNNIPTFSYYRERLLKRSENFVWEGFVHEVIAPKGNVVYCPIAVMHKKEKPAENKRNLKIYNRHIKNGEKLNAREQFYFSRELFYNLKYKQTIVQLKKYLKLQPKFIPNVLDAHAILAKCCLELKQFDEALKWLAKSLVIKCPNAEICCLFGEIFINTNRYIDAIYWYKSALICEKDEISGAFISHEYYNIIPYLQLCYIYYEIGNQKLSKKYYFLAKSVDKNHPSVLFNKQFFEK